MPTMIIVQGLIPLLPDAREKALGLAREVSQASLSESGCLSYEFYVGLRDPNTLMLLQEWESLEALMRHFNTPHVEAFMRELPHIVSGEIVTRRYAVQAVDDGEDDLEPVSFDDASDESPPNVVH